MYHLLSAASSWDCSVSILTIMLNVLVLTNVHLIHIEHCSVTVLSETRCTKETLILPDFNHKSLSPMQHVTSTLGKWIFYILKTINIETIEINIPAFIYICLEEYLSKSHCLKDNQMS